MNNQVVYRADATNAYAEAPPPINKLYIRVDKQYREWYMNRYGIDIPTSHVLPVNHALQGHPEAARLWSTHIHEIFTNKLNLKSPPHEPCLYSGVFQGLKVLILRQVDDFAIAANDSTIITSILNKIDSHLQQKLKRQGLLTSFNGIDIQQSKLFIKIGCHRYICKILEGHG